MRNNGEIDLAPVFEELRTVRCRSKPWRTAKTLAVNCFGEAGLAERVEKGLYRHYQNWGGGPGPLHARYSNFPSRRSLEVIWAHTEHVHVKNLKPLEKYDIAERISFEDNIDLDRKEDTPRPSLFVSHSHKDFRKVVEVANDVSLDWRPWLAEVEIQKYDGINENIIEAISTAEECMVYLSSASLGSRWTGKEVDFYQNNRKPVHFVLDLTDKDVSLLYRALQQRESSFSECEKDRWEVISNYVIWKDILTELRNHRHNNARLYGYNPCDCAPFQLSEEYRLLASG